jgi:predicted DNA-binding transcriptional regulator YafY
MELKMAILSYGAEVEVLEPGHLRKEIKETIEKMGRNYVNRNKEKK